MVQVNASSLDMYYDVTYLKGKLAIILRPY
jgi:hypothetical protein